MSVIRCEIPSNSVEWSDPNGKPGRKDFEMKNYIMLDGRKFEIDEKNSLLLRAVVGKQKEEKKSPFERVRIHKDTYFFMNDWGCVEEDFDDDEEEDKFRYEAANYCTDKALMVQRTLHETLNRLLWRFSLENGGDSEWDWNNAHWYIASQETYRKQLVVDWTSQWHFQGTTYFSSRELAEEALETIVKPFMAEHPEFVW